MSEKNNWKGKIDYYEQELRDSGISIEQARDNEIFETNDKAFVAKLLKRELSKMPKGPYIVYVWRDRLGVNRLFDNKLNLNLDGETKKELESYGIKNPDEILLFKVKASELFKGAEKDAKYMATNGCRNHIKVDKLVSLEDLLDVNKPLLIVEGEKKTFCANIFNKGAIAVGVGGVNNFTTVYDKDEGEAELIKELSNLIPLKGRKVLIGYDNDIHINDKIQKAENSLVNVLQKRGADVRVLRIPYKDKKMGVDDYIIEHGVEEFQKLCKEAGLPANTPVEEIEKYLSDSKSLSSAEKINKIRTVQVAIASKSKEEITLLVDKVSKSVGLPKTQVKEVINNSKPNFQKKKSSAGKTIIHHDPKINNQDDLIEKVVKAFKESDRVYKMGNEVCAFRFNNREALISRNFNGVLVGYAIVKWRDEYISIPANEVSTVLNSSRFLSAFPEVKLYTTTITYDNNWNLVQPNFNPDSEIFYDGKVIAPYFSNDLIEKMVEEYCFKNEASKHNFFGALLTVILRHKWQGGKPFFAITGNQPGLGKSQLAQLAVVIGTGEDPETFTYTPNEEEMEKKIGSQIDITDILNIDNVKSNKPIDSKSFESLITSPIPSFRRLGTSERIKRVNTFVSFMSLNNAVYVPDLLTRMCPIELWLEGPANRRKFKNPDLIKWTKQNREKLVATLIGWVENWKKKGMPTVSIDCRFGVWAGVIGGILKVNGYDKFMTNFESAMSSYDKEIIEAGELFSSVIGKDLSLEEILGLAEKYKVFKDIVGKPNAKSLIGAELSKMVGQSLPLPDGGKFVIEKGQDPKKRTVVYRATVKEVGTVDKKENKKEEIDFNNEGEE